MFGDASGGSQGSDGAAAADANEQSTATVTGYLLKKGDNVVSPWQSRWFEVTGHYLKYYKSLEVAGNKDYCLAAVDLNLCEITNPAGRSFGVVPEGNTAAAMSLKAADDAAAERWVSALRECQWATLEAFPEGDEDDEEDGTGAAAAAPGGSGGGSLAAASGGAAARGSSDGQGSSLGLRRFSTKTDQMARLSSSRGSTSTTALVYNEATNRVEPNPAFKAAPTPTPAVAAAGGAPARGGAATSPAKPASGGHAAFPTPPPAPGGATASGGGSNPLMETALGPTAAFPKVSTYRARGLSVAAEPDFGADMPTKSSLSSKVLL